MPFFRYHSRFLPKSDRLPDPAAGIWKWRNMMHFFKQTGSCFPGLLLLGALFSPLAPAAIETGLPSGLCSSQYYHCDAGARASWSRFLDAGGFSVGETGFLSVGHCSRNGDSNSQVYVLLAMSRITGNIHFDAKISFFNDLREYTRALPAQIPVIFPDIHLPRNKMTLTDSHAYIDYADLGPYRYWIRYHHAGGKMLMVAYFGFKDTFLCEFG